MIIYKTKDITDKDREDIKSTIDSISDIYGDFYITKNNIRFFIKENSHLLYDSLIAGDKILYESNEGIIFIHGYSDNSHRKFIKVLTKNNQILGSLLEALRWQITEDLYIKIKKNNPIYKALLTYDFKFKGSRGKEILLIQKGTNHAE